ncbi:hypothetical protein GWI33_015445 [Rhynchophorus ferrugineus]|uniref:Uncharacterized protein n=1 Tax=Rhynchophorus ferrugineus TaxID=354439 RepID=A0A834I2J7_RHYFE|nr:hypothetical protein GWI33_015445 [Rhynchophorus ferrugineus]
MCENPLSQRTVRIIHFNGPGYKQTKACRTGPTPVDAFFIGPLYHVDVREPNLVCGSEYETASATTTTCLIHRTTVRAETCEALMGF